MCNIIVYFISKGAVKLVNEYGQSIYALTEGTYFGEVETLAEVNIKTIPDQFIVCLGKENIVLSSD